MDVYRCEVLNHGATFFWRWGHDGYCCRRRGPFTQVVVSSALVVDGDTSTNQPAILIL